MPEAQKPLLSFADLKNLIAAAEQAGLADPEARRPLFGRIGDIRNRLPVNAIPRLQLVGDLTILNEYAFRPGQIPPLITWRVVSSPPMRMSNDSWMSASSLSFCPSTSAWTRMLMRSSVGVARRSSMAPET